MFDFSASRVYVGVGGVFSLYSQKKASGIALDIGDSVIHVVPVWEGYALPYAVDRLDMGGREITETLRKLIAQTQTTHKEGRFLQSSAGKQIAREIKETLGYVAADFDSEAESMKDYNMPDGSIL